MPRNAKTAESRTYSMHVAQLNVADFTTGTRRLYQAQSTPRSLPVSDQRTSPIVHVVNTLDRSIPLPNSPRSFLIYTAALLLIAAGMLVNVLLSAQLLQSQVQVANLQNTEEIIERNNAELLWEITRATNLKQVQARALAAGYRPILRREYVEVPPPNADAAPTTALHGSVTAVPSRDESAVAPRPTNPTSLPSQWWTIVVGDSQVELDTPADTADAEMSVRTTAQDGTEIKAAPWWFAVREKLKNDAVSIAERIKGE